MNLPFENPYSGDKDVKRITTDVSSGDYYLIKSTRPGLATITGTLGILWKKLCHELRKRNITDYTHVSEFEQFVANCNIVAGDAIDSRELNILRGVAEETSGIRQDPPSDDGRGRTDRTTSGFNDASTPPYVGRGTQAESPSNPSAPPVLPDVQSGSGKGRKRTKAERGGTE